MIPTCRGSAASAQGRWLAAQLEGGVRPEHDQESFRFHRNLFAFSLTQHTAKGRDSLWGVTLLGMVEVVRPGAEPPFTGFRFSRFTDTLPSSLRWFLRSNLTPDESQRLPRLGDKSLAFDEKCTSSMAARPDLVPALVNVPELAKSPDLRADIADILCELDPLHQSVADMGCSPHSAHF